MPTSAAYARRLLQRGKARWVAHYAFPIIELTHAVEHPILQPLTLSIRIHIATAEIVAVASGGEGSFPLFHMVVDLGTDIVWRMRRRAGHRRRRRLRRRFRAARRYARPYKARRPSVAKSLWPMQHGWARPRAKRAHLPAVVRWRAEALWRVVHTLQKLIPISHVDILNPRTKAPIPAQLRPGERREYLIECYGHMVGGHRRAVCAYCGTSRGQIEVDHILPQSRGGTDTWGNLTLACATCNQRKGQRTPEEAGMRLRIPPRPHHQSPRRYWFYIYWTAHLLLERLSASSLATSWDSPQAHAASADQQKQLLANAPRFVAKPIARATKQIFSSRNYPLSTQLRAGWRRHRSAMKRLIKVNEGLWLTATGRHNTVRVIQRGEPIPTEPGQFITRGMLCEGQ